MYQNAGGSVQTRLRQSIVMTMMDREDSRDDTTRTHFTRREAEVGLYVDAYEATAINPQDHGTELCFIMELPDKLYAEFQKVPLDVIKGNFERHKILDGVIIEKLHKCNVFSCSFETPEALENMWKEYENDEIGPVMHETLGTPAIAAAVGAKDLYLRTRIYKDEVDDCRQDIKQGKKPDFDFEADRDMLNKVKDYQQNQLTTSMLLLREEWGKFEATLGDFTLIIKQNVPADRQEINTFAEFETIYEQIKAKRINNKCFDNFFRVRKSLREALEQIDMRLCHRLAQVHGAYETERQKQVRAEIKTKRQTAIDRLDPEFNHAKLRHVEWASKIVLKEHKLFLGLVSVVALGVDTVIDIDQFFDEYISGLSDYKLTV